MDKKCFVCKSSDGKSCPDDEGHYAASLLFGVGEDGAVNVDIYPHLFFNNIVLCDECKEELSQKIILEIADRLTFNKREQEEG